MPSNNGRQRKAKRKSEAKARNDAWAALTPAQQIDSLNYRRLNASRQRSKIQKQLDK